MCIVSRVEDAELCYELGVPCVWYPNEELGAKWNYGLQHTIPLEWDYLVTLGSDDIVKPSMLDLYAEMKLTDVVIMDKIHFIDVPTGRASILTKARVGAGRRISRRVIEACKYKLWTDDMNKSLDMDSNRTINKAGFPTTELRTYPHIVGLKSMINIWHYDHTLKFSMTSDQEQALSGLLPQIKSEILELLPKA